MAHTYVSNMVHCVFSTKERRKSISPELQKRLWAFLGGIARKNEFTALAVGGMSDHAHVFLSLPATMPLAKAVQLLKGGSSKWIHDHFPQLRTFEWQSGYGAFSVGVSQIEETVAYIQNQEQHNRRRDFQEEFLLFLKRNQIPYDAKYVWG